MSCNVKSLKSRITTGWFLEAIIPSSHEVFYDFESDMVVGMTQLANQTRKIAKSNDTAKQVAGS